MSKKPSYQTEHARRGDDLRGTFEGALSKSFASFTVSMTAPEGSTGGGVRALQHITLISKDGFVLVVGAANGAEKTAELKTLGYTLTICKQRFGVEIKI